MAKILCPEFRPVTLIEYNRLDDGRYVPFTVMSVGFEYAFEYCRRDDQLYYTMVGAGHGVGYGVTPFGRFCKKRPRRPLWYDRSRITPGRYVRGLRLRPFRSRVRKNLRRMGLEPIRSPLVLSNGWLDAIDPFETSIDESTVYCRVCNDWLPIENECEHLWWCERCSGFTGPGADDPCCPFRDMESWVRDNLDRTVTRIHAWAVGICSDGLNSFMREFFPNEQTVTVRELYSLIVKGRVDWKTGQEIRRVFHDLQRYP